jgi:hypothetical protein
VDVAILAESGGNPLRAPSPSTPTAMRAVVTPTPTGTIALACEPTRSRDASGVVTVDGRHGVAGETFTHGEDMNGTF